LWSWMSRVRIPSLTPCCIAGDLEVWQGPEVFANHMVSILVSASV